MTAPVERELAVTVAKGQGRQGLVGGLELALVLDDARILPGVYSVTVRRLTDRKRDPEASP